MNDAEDDEFDMGPKPGGGFSLLEVMIVMAILTVGILGVLAAFTEITRQNRSAIFVDLAIQGERSKIEEMRATSFTAVFLNYTTGSPGSQFHIQGIPPSPTANFNDKTVWNTSAQGTIKFLGETDVQNYWGMTADFNGDGATNTAAPTTAAQAASWTALPVSVTVLWKDITDSSARAITFTTVIYNSNQ